MPTMRRSAEFALGFALATIMCVAGERETALVIQGIDKAQLDREENLAGYTVTERYTISNSRFRTPAQATVETTYLKNSGKSYKVISRSGPSVLQSFLLDKILAEDEAMSRGDQRKKALITSANYRMKALNRDTLNGRACDVVELDPIAKGPHLLKGKAWFDAENHMLVRIEGQAIASPTFLAGKPDVSRDYANIEGLSLATRSRAVSSSFFLGKTEVVVEYTGYRVTKSR